MSTTNDLFIESPAPFQDQYKISICGDAEVGKTHLVSHFTERAFSGKPTVGADISYRLIRAGEEGEKKVRVIVWDLSGQPSFSEVRGIFYQGSHAVLYVYDISRRGTIATLPRWVQESRKHMDEKVPCVLIGNKIDLEEEREIDLETGQKFADRLDTKLFETSAIDGSNVLSAFAEAIRRAVEFRTGS